MAEQADVQVTLTLSADTAELLSALIDGTYATDLESVLRYLADCARQGIQRPGSWERGWLVQAFGDDWLERVERHPQVPHRDRVRKDGDGA